MGKLRFTQSLTATGPAGAGGGGKPFTPSVQDRTAAVARGLSLVLRHHDCPSELIIDGLHQISESLNTAMDERVWVKRLKNLLARPLALYLKNEPPPDSDLVFKPSGAFRRWINNRLHAFNDKNTHLWYSWFQVKRCCLPSSEEFISDTYKEHLQSLTSPDPGDEFAIDAAFSNRTFSRVLERLRNGLDSYMETEESSYRSTQSACFEATRDCGGQFKYLKRTVAMQGCGWTSSLVRNKDPIVEWELVGFTDELHSMFFRPKTLGLLDVVVVVRQPYGFEDWDSLDLLVDRLDWNRNLCCEIKGVVEPLKVRVISKGEALYYYSQRKLQRALHDQMREMPCFRLIGRPFSPTDLMDLREGCLPDYEWFSVDYSAATDGLSWKFTSRILRYLLAHRPDTDLNRALRVLGPHDLYYPQRKEGSDKWGPRMYEGTQTNGQLMGSILSFPILCLANLATYLLTMSGVHFEEDLSDEERLHRVLVNGDDMVYAAPPSLWGRHVKIGTDLGLKMSVGKAYHHDSYANINSTSVVFPMNKSGTPREVPYLNVGLFFQEPVQKKETDDKKIARKERDDDRAARGLARSHHDTEGVVACVSELLRGCRSLGKQHEILAGYLALHQDSIRDETKCLLTFQGRTQDFHRNLFTHPSVGGMGIIPPSGWKFRIKPVEKILGANLMARIPTKLSFGLPLSGFPIPDLRNEAACPWDKPQVITEVPTFRVSNSSIKCHKRILILGFTPVAPNPSWFNYKPLRRVTPWKTSSSFLEDASPFLESSSCTTYFPPFVLPDSFYKSRKGGLSSWS